MAKLDGQGTALDVWEQRLRPRMTTVDLIGELDLMPEEAQEIGRLIALLIHAYGPQEATRLIERRYPSAFAAYLVFQGGYSYDRGDFWGGVCAGAGLPNEGNYTVAWGQAFERICRRFGLAREFAGHRYVGAILGHGGVPARSLPDFFEHMLHPSIARPELAAFTTPDLILEWLAGSAQYHVDKPILRFLEYGGKVAEDFVERCRRMAREQVEDGEVPSADEIGLSGSLVDAYHEWVNQSGLARASTRSGWRTKKPSIVLDPWGLSLHVVLPEQQIPPTQSLAESWWEIDADGTTDRISVDARRVDMDLKTRAAYATIQGPAREYRVRFYRQTESAHAELLREWKYDGLSATLPFLVFDPATGELMPQLKRLPARLLWILCPPGATLQSDPTSQSLIQERLPQLPWAWHTWRGYQLNLQGINTLKLSSSLGQSSIPIVEAQEGLTAELVNAAQLDSLEDLAPVFVGTPPALRIHMREEDSPRGHLECWRLELNHEWSADPERILRCRLSELNDLIIQQADIVEVPLAHPRLLGAAPVGQYRIRLRGPLGRSADLRFRIAPRLYLTGHEALYLPEPGKGAPVAHVLIETDPQSQIELLQSEPDFRLEELTCDEQSRCYQVAVPPDRADAPLRLVRHVATDRSAYIPLRIPIRRLRWLLILKPDQLAKPVWQSNPSAINLAELEQSVSPYLVLELPVPEDSRTDAQLRFLGVSDELIAELGAPRPTGPARLRRFDLRSVRDALRASQSPAVRVELKVVGLPEHNALALTVLTLRRSITIERANVGLRQVAPDQHLDVTWEPEIPLRNRHIHLWSQTRPWAEPLAFPIPDAAQRSHTFLIPAEAMPAGRYLVEFLVRDPWLPETAPFRPQPTAPNVASVMIGSLEERLIQLDTARRASGDMFSDACESAFLWQALGQTERAVANLRQCWECLNAASLPQMMALAREFQDQPTGKAFRIRLYRTEQIKEVLAAYRNGDLPESVAAEYLAGLPPLHKLAPEAGEVLLEAPDERIQLAAARHLIEQGKAEGMVAVLAWEEAGKLSEEGLNELMALNPRLAISCIQTRTEQIVAELPSEQCAELAQETESDDLRLIALRCLIRRGEADGVKLTLALKARKIIDDSAAWQLLELRPELAAKVILSDPGWTAVQDMIQQFLTRHPDTVPAIHTGAWVKCKLGWGQIQSIRSVAGQLLHAVPEELAANGITLDVRLQLDDGFSDSTIQMGHTGATIRTGPKLYVCKKCRCCVAKSYQAIVRHNRQEHGGVANFEFQASGCILHEAESLDFSSGPGKSR